MAVAILALVGCNAPAQPSPSAAPGAIPVLGTEVPPLAQPFDLVPILVGVWMVIGIVLYVVIRRVRPDAIAKIGEAVTEA